MAMIADRNPAVTDLVPLPRVTTENLAGRIHPRAAHVGGLVAGEVVGFVVGGPIGLAVVLIVYIAGQGVRHLVLSSRSEQPTADARAPHGQVTR